MAALVAALQRCHVASVASRAFAAMAERCQACGLAFCPQIQKRLPSRVTVMRKHV